VQWPKRTFEQFPSLLSMLMSTIEDENLHDTLCIIDGLDECEPKSRDLLVKSLATYFTIPVQPDSDHQAHFKMVILGRPDNLMQRRLQLFGKDSTERSVNGSQRRFRLMAEDEITAIAKGQEHQSFYSGQNRRIRTQVRTFGRRSSKGRVQIDSRCRLHLSVGILGG
jgi:hypothetical protein